MMDLLGFENWKNWPDQFEKKHATSWTQSVILERVRRLETLHWKMITLGGLMCSFGGSLVGVGITSGNDITFLGGCTSLILGFLIMLSTKIASTTCLCTYQILWDIRKSEEEAVCRSEIEDL